MTIAAPNARFIGVDPGSKRCAVVSLPSADPATWTTESVLGKVYSVGTADNHRDVSAAAASVTGAIDATLKACKEQGAPVVVVLEWNDKPFAFHPRKGATDAEILVCAKKNQAVMEAREIMILLVDAVRRHCAAKAADGAAITCVNIGATSARKHAGVVAREVSAEGARARVDDVAVREHMRGVLLPDVYAKLTGGRNADPASGQADVLDAAVAAIGWARFDAMPVEPKKPKPRRDRRKVLPCGCRSKHQLECEYYKPPVPKKPKRVCACEGGTVEVERHIYRCPRWTRVVPGSWYVPRSPPPCGCPTHNHRITCPLFVKRAQTWRDERRELRVKMGLSRG